MKAGKNGLGLAVALAPVIFICHILEESTGYVAWFNEHVRNGITMPLFWRVNTLSLAITLLVMSMELVKPSIFSAFLIVLWFGFLMLANAVFHIIGAIVTQHYMPGLITAALLYLPYYFFLVGQLLQRVRLTLPVAIILFIIGSAPTLIQGYLVIFRGARLF